MILVAEATGESMATEIDAQRAAAEDALRKLHRIINPHRPITPPNITLLDQRSDKDLTALEMALAEAFRRLLLYHKRRTGP
jgi:hypothetical protein